MMCECSKQIDKLLEPKGECLNIAFDLKGRTFYIVKVSKIFGGRGKTSIILAKYCPFCGKKQEET